MTASLPKFFDNLTTDAPRSVVETRPDCKEKLMKKPDFAKKSYIARHTSCGTFSFAHVGATLMRACLPVSALRWIVTSLSPSIQPSS